MPVKAFSKIACASYVVMTVSAFEDINGIRESHSKRWTLSLRILIEEKPECNVDFVRRSLAEFADLDRRIKAKPAFAKILLAQNLCFGEAKVEPEGIEPSSKRPQYGLSTCVAGSLVLDHHPGNGTLVKA